MIYPEMDAVLTPSQQGCLRLVAKQMTSKEIARELGLSPHTVDGHIRAAMRRLGVTNRNAAAQLLGGEVDVPCGRERDWPFPPGQPLRERGFPGREDGFRGKDVNYRAAEDIPYQLTPGESAPYRAAEVAEDWRIYRPLWEEEAPQKEKTLSCWQWWLVILGVAILAANLFLVVKELLRT